MRLDLLFLVLLAYGCGARQPSAVESPAKKSEPGSQAVVRRHVVPGAYEIPVALFRKHGIGVEGALSRGACPAVPITVLSEVIPEISAGVSIIGSQRSNASPLNEGTASIDIALNPEHIAPHLLQTREVWCKCDSEGLQCHFVRRKRAFDENPAETFELEQGASLDEALQIVRLYRAGAIRLKYKEKHPDDLKTMRVTSVGRSGRGFRVNVSTNDGYWGGVLELRIVKLGSRSRLEVLHGEFGGI